MRVGVPCGVVCVCCVCTVLCHLVLCVLRVVSVTVCVVLFVSVTCSVCVLCVLCAFCVLCVCVLCAVLCALGVGCVVLHAASAESECCVQRVGDLPTTTHTTHNLSAAIYVQAWRCRLLPPGEDTPANLGIRREPRTRRSGMGRRRHAMNSGDASESIRDTHGFFK